MEISSSRNSEHHLKTSFIGINIKKLEALHINTPSEGGTHGYLSYTQILFSLIRL